MKVQIIDPAGRVVLESDNPSLIESVAQAQYALDLRAAFRAAEPERFASQADIRHARVLEMMGA